MCALKPTVFEGKDRVNKSRCYIECDVERSFRSRIVAPKFARNAAEEETLSSSEKNVCNICVSDKYLICKFARSEEVEFAA